MSETLNNMKDAVVGGRGGKSRTRLRLTFSLQALSLIVTGGLQSTSTAIGDSIAENTNAAQSNSSKKADEASASLGEFGKGMSGLVDHLR